MSDKMERASMLLGIVSAVPGAAPKLTAISGEAMAELNQINEDLRKVQQRRADEAKQRLEEEHVKRNTEREIDDTPRVNNEDPDRQRANAEADRLRAARGQPVADPIPSQPAIPQGEDPVPSPVDPEPINPIRRV